MLPRNNSKENKAINEIPSFSNRKLTPAHPKLPSWSSPMLAKTDMLTKAMQRLGGSLLAPPLMKINIYNKPVLYNALCQCLPPRKTRTIHHVRIVPTLSLATKQSLSDSGIALLLVLHSRLQDTWVRKID
jgi:hypothetical protein